MRSERGEPQDRSVGECCEPGVCPLAGACVCVCVWGGRLNELVGWVGTVVH